MKFLIEKSLITPEQEKLYKSLDSNKKTKFIQDLLKNHPNYNNIKDALTLYSDAIYDYGFDDVDNPFIKFMSKVKQDLPYEIVSLLWTLSKNKKLNMDRAIRYLNIPSLYKGDTKEVLNKVKALTYSLNDDLQQNASRKITPELLMDKSGKFLSYPEMEKVLNKITISKSDGLTIQNALDKLYGYKDLKNKNNVIQFKNKFKKLIQSHKQFNDNMLSMIDNTPIETLVKIPISNSTEESIKQGLIKYLTGNITLKDSKPTMTGEDILSQYLKVKNLTLGRVVEYIKTIIPEDIMKSSGFKDKINLESTLDAIDKVLDSTISSTRGRNPLNILNSRLIDVFKPDDKQKSTVADVISSQLNTDKLDADTIHAYIGKLIDNAPGYESNKKRLMKQQINTGAFDNRIDRILGTPADKVKSHMGRDVDELIADLILNDLEKAM